MLPSAGFTQGWGFLVLDTREDVDRFREAATPESDPDRWFAANVRVPPIIGAIFESRLNLGRARQRTSLAEKPHSPGWTEVVHRGRWELPARLTPRG